MELKLTLGDMLQDNPKSFNLIDGFNSFDKIKYIDNKICGTITQHQSRSSITNGFKIQSVPIKVDEKYFLTNKGIEYLNKKQVFNKFNPLTKESELSVCITARCNKVSNDNNFIKNKKKIRRLTPLECWRLQGFIDDDFFNVEDVSDTQLYKQAGNSISVNVLMELFKKIYANDNK